MSELPLLPSAVLDEARQGAWCPKLCTFACPVHEATGRADAVPWSFHRALVDLDEGRRDAPDVAPELVACTGCLACQQPCEFDQDVPAQVRAGRSIARPTSEAAERALEHLAAGALADGSRRSAPQTTTGTVLHAGCHDPDEVVDAAVRLLTAAGHEVTVVADGCCGRLADDLGDPDLGARRRDHRRDQLAGATRLVSLDPHCAPALGDATGLAVEDLWSVLAPAPPAFRADDDAAPVAWHDPCLLAREAGVVTPPRQLLDRAGVPVHEPEHHGTGTACSGAGLGLPLLDPDAADATAAHRAGHLTDAADRTVTGCSRAATQLRRAGVEVAELATTLADRLADRPEDT